ncbi:hypothetical protein GGR53DRAFT_533176 [Hypoxylon sp. FL1150]|nr:hypothetical protein GGR53DRAFT_533176 [Hypoxylon sp. FL1150]
MCFTEFMGYTCGHTSMSVKRLCPLTTQLFNNPCCANNAVRPILAVTFCPACARILHGRWVNILESEHRFMHERGVCGCSAQFPYLQQPRVVSQNYADDDGHQSSGSLTPVPYSPATTRTAVTYSDLSGSAMPFVPNSHGRSTQYAAEEMPWNPSKDAAPFGPGASASFRQRSEGSGTEASSVTGVTVSSSGSGRDKRGKSKQRRVKRVQAQAQKSRALAEGQGNRSGQAGQNQQQLVQLHQAQLQDLQQHFSASSTAAAEGSGHQLAPLFEERKDVAHQKPVVSIRMPSLYGAEWLQDHKVLHQEGRCSCAVRFERYESPEMPIVDEAGPRVPKDINNLADFSQHYPQASTSNGGPATTDENSAQNHMANSMPHVTTQPGHPARWACSPENVNDGNTGEGASGSSSGLASYASHPVDMQTAWYNQTEVPLAGLPIGAGPEGDSHMPSFGDCELNHFQTREHHYPEYSRHRRGVSQ